MPESHHCTLEIHLFGAPRVLLDGQPMPHLRTRAGFRLLVMLLFKRGRPIERNWLAGSLWPDSPQSGALANLRVCLADLRRALGSEAHRLQAPTPRTLLFDPEGVFVDLFAFDAALARGDVASLESAIALYRGEMLEGYDDDLLLPERLARTAAYHTALEQLAVHCIASRSPRAAVYYLRKLVAQDPLRESAQQLLMEALAAAGDLAAVTQVYREFRLYLADELRGEPASETTRIHQTLTAASPEQNRPIRGEIERPPGGYLPRPLTDLVGREAESAEVEAHLMSARLVTLTGPGGIGKTRLALHVAERLGRRFNDGVRYVDLAALTSSDLVPGAVAAALMLREEAGRPALEALQQHLKCRALLLVLDNGEHLVAACTFLSGALLKSCPGLHILITSRQALALPGEVVIPVPPLSLPDRSMLQVREKDHVTALLEYDAVRLFVERARQARPALKLTAQGVRAIVEICLRLDGMPLAIELTAAWARFLSVVEINERLDRRLRLIVGDGASAFHGQRTVWAAIESSLVSLKEQERLLLCRLSVFAGGWTLEAAEEVCSGEGIERDSIQDALTGLIAKSLVMMTERGDRSRYRMLEPIRQYCLERLEREPQQAGLLARRYRDYFRAFAAEAAAGLVGPDERLSLDALDADFDNIRAVLTACHKSADGAETALVLPALLPHFLRARGHASEGLRHLEAALNHPDAGSYPLEQAKALSAAGTLANSLGDFAGSRRYHEASLALCKELNFSRGVAGCLNNLGNTLRKLGENEAARSHFMEALTLSREMGNRLWEGLNLTNLGLVAYFQGDYDGAMSFLVESRTLARELNNPRSLASSLHHIGLVALAASDYAAARSSFEQSLALYRDLDDQTEVASCLTNLALVASNQDRRVEALNLFESSLEIARRIGHRDTVTTVLENMATLFGRQGDHPAAITCLIECLEICRETGAAYAIANALYGTASLAQARRQPYQAVSLHAAAARIRASAHIPLTPRKQREYEAEREALMAQLGEALFAEAETYGGTMDAERAISYALNFLL
jgi:non-specific serine/threonine protein kinase